MPITMQHAEHLTPVEMQQFLDAGATLSFAGTGRKPVYALLGRTLRACQYPSLSKKDKGIVRRYLVKVSGLSRSQITRLIARWRERGVIEPRASRRRRFPRRYTPDADASHAATRPTISLSWPLSTRPTKASRPRPCVAFSNANSRSTPRPTINDWPRSRPPTSTTCGAPGPIASTTFTTPKLAPWR